MELSFWNLPGPSSFLKEVAQALDNRNIVASVLPDYLDKKNFYRALNNTLNEGLEVIAIDPELGDPLIAFGRELNYHDSELYSVSVLHEKLQELGQVFLVKGICKCSFEVYKNYISFINTLGELARQEQTDYSLLFMLAPNDNYPQQDLRVKNFFWWGYLRQSDLLIKIEQCIKNYGQLSSAEQYWIRALCHGLARTDLSLVPTLIERCPKNEDEIISTIEDGSKSSLKIDKYNWNLEVDNSRLLFGDTKPSPPQNKKEVDLWNNGLIEWVENVGKVIHPSALISKEEQVMPMIKQGQIDLFFPLVERVRASVIHWLYNKIGSDWQGLHRKDSENFCDDLCNEIGPLYHFYFTPPSDINHREKTEVAKLLYKWKEIRNKLAHSVFVPFGEFESAIECFSSFIKKA